VNSDASTTYVTLASLLAQQDAYKEKKEDYENEVRRVGIVN